MGGALPAGSGTALGPTRPVPGRDRPGTELHAALDTDEFVALSGLAEAEAFGHLDDALAARIVEPASAGYRFRHCLIRDALTGEVPAHRRRQVHRDTARRLVELGASPVRIGHHLLAAGAGADAVPHVLRAAETNPPWAPTATRWRWSTRSGHTPSAPAGPGRSRCVPTCSPR
jgi:hypothetical protein